MAMTDINYQALNLANGEARLEAAKRLSAGVQHDSPEYEDVNGHIHTTFSFSPYSPCAAVYMARMSGLSTAGIMDHDTMAGAAEFLSAGNIFGLPVTVGIECRVSLKGTPYEGVRTNNPDQDGCAYMSIHGVPHANIGALDGQFVPLRRARGQRNRQMVETINRNYAEYGISIDYERDVLPLSQAADGGSVTERHISMALAQKLMLAYGKGQGLLAFLCEKLGVSPQPAVRDNLLSERNTHYLYDLIGLIKSDIITGFYIPAQEELLPVGRAVEMARDMGAIPCVPYLGDVTSSVTGDKRAQRFEDAFLDEWIAFARNMGFLAITYMPSRNTDEQISRLRGLIAKHGLWEISGEDINSPRQAFVCQKLRDRRFDALRDSAFALIAHEKRSVDPDDGFFGRRSVSRWPDMRARARVFADMIRCEYDGGRVYGR